MSDKIFNEITIGELLNGIEERTFWFAYNEEEVKIFAENKEKQNLLDEIQERKDTTLKSILQKIGVEHY